MRCSDKERVSHMATAAYQRERRARIVGVCFPSLEDLAAKQKMAEKAGYAHNFAGWLLQQIQNATSGNVYPPEYVEGLRKEAERLREWLESAQEQVSDYRARERVLQAQRDDLLLLVTKKDPEGAAAFLAKAKAQGVSA